MNEKTVILNQERQVSLTPYIVSDKKAPTILICPGGGYTTSELKEGEIVAKAYNGLGLNAFVLCYSVGTHYKWPYPMDDFNQAMRYIVDNAERYLVDKNHIIAAGFSAGGHLVSLAASKAEIKPYAVIICYGATKQSVIEYSAPGAEDAVEAVNINTCPCFIVSSRNDWIVPIDCTTEFVDALNRHYIDYELHVYGYAMHGFSIGKPAGAEGPLFCSRVGNWVKESAEWIDELISGRYISIRDGAEYNDNFAKILSTKNSCKTIFQNARAVEILQKKFPEIVGIYEQISKQIGSFVDGVTLRNVFQFLGLAVDIPAIDKALSDLSTN